MDGPRRAPFGTGSYTILVFTSVTVRSKILANFKYITNRLNLHKINYQSFN